MTDDIAMDTAVKLSAPVESDVIILGAGVSGLTAAADLVRENLKIRIIDDYLEPGGNHFSRDYGPYTFDVGSIFFWSDSPLLEIFPGIGDHWTPAAYDRRRITPAGRVLRYPFELGEELLSRPKTEIARVATDIIKHRLFVRKNASAADFGRYYLGEQLLQESGLGYYLGRFYGLPIDDISYNFALRRMQWIASNASLRQRVGKIVMSTRRKLGLAPKPQARHSFTRPRAGFEVMYRHALNQLLKDGVEATLDAGVTSVMREGGRFHVHSRKGTFTAKRLINTIPVMRAAELFGIDNSNGPESSDLVTLCCRFRGKRNFAGVVLYNFHKEGLWKRLTMHSEYYGLVDGWEYFAVEITVLDASLSVPELLEDFKRTTSQVGLFDGELEMLGHFRTAYAYPVFDQTAAAKRAVIIGKLEALGIETFGRQGDFDYIPSATEAVVLAREALEREKTTKRLERVRENAD